MDNTRSTKNYAAHGGNEWVIGGRLTFLPGATVEGLEGFLGNDEAVKIPFFPDSKATSAAALRDDFNKFLAALRDAGVMVTERNSSPSETPGDAE